MLLAALILGLAFTDLADAETRISTWATYYGDDNGVTVLSPSFIGSTSISDRVDLELEYDLDVITGASLDVVTGATRTEWNDVRHGFSAGAAWRFLPDFSIGARYLPSVERDYVSHGVALEASGEWFRRRLRTDLHLRWSGDRTRAAGQQDWRKLATYLASLEASLVLDARTVVSLGYELQHVDGYQGSPYRWVHITIFDTPGGGIGESVLPERPPNSRWRHAVRVGLQRAFGERLFLAGAYRFYTDSWSIRSHTAELDARWAFLGRTLSAGIFGRFYIQNGAWFYRSVYEGSWGELPITHTADKLLGPMWSVLVGVRADLRLPLSGSRAELSLTPKLELYQQVFLDNPTLRHRTAVLGSFGIGVAF